MPVTTVHSYRNHPTVSSNQQPLFVPQTIDSPFATGDNHQTSSISLNNGGCHLSDPPHHRPVNCFGQPAKQSMPCAPTAPEMDLPPPSYDAVINLSHPSEVKNTEQ